MKTDIRVGSPGVLGVPQIERPAAILSRFLGVHVQSALSNRTPECVNATILNAIGNNL